jgi:hypothetical protein
VPPSKKPAIPHYPHFDALISLNNAKMIVSSPSLVSRHSFLPLLSYVKRWVPYKLRNSAEPLKERTICYAARRDSFIFSHYRDDLEPRFENKLKALGLASNILAYRKIPVPGKNRNKSNIRFARDAFVKVSSMAPCFAICLDISGFFDSIDHEYLRKAWCKLLNVDRLPVDHFAVFKAATFYSHVNRIAAYTALGIIAPKIDTSGKQCVGYTIQYHKLPKQLCDPATFRDVIKPLVQRNNNSFGIPQGLPISAFLSNLYLLEFDTAVKKLISEKGGEYYRYSDDILVLLPVGCDPEKLEQAIIAEIEKTGPKMHIKTSKCSVHECIHDPLSGNLRIRQIKPPSGFDGLEYLGYRFDGRKIFIRSSTLSRLHRKIIYSIRWHVKRLLASNEKASLKELIAHLNVDLIHGRFSRRPNPKKETKNNTSKKKNNANEGTFFSYAKLSNEDHELIGSGSISQLRKLKKYIRWRADLELTEAYRKVHKP